MFFKYFYSCIQTAAHQFEHFKSVYPEPTEDFSQTEPHFFFLIT